MCSIKLQIYFKFRLSKAVLIAFCGLISILLKSMAHPLYEIFSTTLKGLYKTIGVTHMDMVQCVQITNVTNCTVVLMQKHP